MSAPDELWVVIDEDGAPDLAVTYPEAAQEHINDALDTMPEDAADIAKWRSVRYIRADAPKADSAQQGPLADRITAYLCGGGLFNPELANHDAVRDLLIDCRNAMHSHAADSAIADALGDRIDEYGDHHTTKVAVELAEYVASQSCSILAALRAQPGGAVPREPTAAMIDAARSKIEEMPMAGFDETAERLWTAMHDAATKADAREAKT